MKAILKNKQKIKLGIIIIISLLNSTLNASAQVTIGLGEEPVSGALLQMKDIKNAPAGDINSYKGIGLPRVDLTDLENLYPMFLSDPNDPTSGPTSEYGTNKASIDAKHTGLVVYNVGNEHISTDMYYWDGTKWNATAKKESGGSITDQYVNFKIITGVYTVANPYIVQDDDYVLILRFQGTGTNGSGDGLTDGKFTTATTVPALNTTANLLLPDPTTCKGRIIRLINDNHLIDRTKTVDVFTNYPMFCYDTLMQISYTSIPTDYRFYVVKDGPNWYKWNLFSDGQNWISLSPVEM